MPYISEQRRPDLDAEIDRVIKAILGNISRPIANNRSLSNEELLLVLGDLNYVMSRIVGSLMGQISYSKIAMITGVLENVKQEFYRRAASPYEDTKKAQNGDIREYKYM